MRIRVSMLAHRTEDPCPLAITSASPAIARDLASGVDEDFDKDLPSAVACFDDDFEACSFIKGTGRTET